LAVVCTILAACLITLLKKYHSGMNKHSLTSKIIVLHNIKTSIALFNKISQKLQKKK
jgi:hypothetical protein